MRFLGVDFGNKKSGIALGDFETRIVAPLEVIKTEALLKRLQILIKDEDIEKIIIGLPLNEDGTRSKQVEQTMEFVNELKKVIDVEVFDERFTTQESQYLQKMGDKMEEDALAAMIILESYFEENK